MSADLTKRLQQVNQRLRGSNYWLLEQGGKIQVRYLSPVACPRCGMAETLAEFLTIEAALWFLKGRTVVPV
ncbi:MAG: hypothetical protein ACYCPA_00635 [Acidithiobacillus sp.]